MQGWDNVGKVRVSPTSSAGLSAGLDENQLVERIVGSGSLPSMPGGNQGRAMNEKISREAERGQAEEKAKSTVLQYPRAVWAWIRAQPRWVQWGLGIAVLLLFSDGD